MNQYSKSYIILTSILLMSLPIVNSSSVESEVGHKLTSPVEDGIWVNNTLEVNGSTTLPPQDADWALYDVTDPNIESSILASGEFFTSVTPIAEGLWIWSIVIDVSGFNCTCLLEVTQIDGSGEESLNRIIFIGEGQITLYYFPR